MSKPTGSYLLDPAVNSEAEILAEKIDLVKELFESEVSSGENSGMVIIESHPEIGVNNGLEIKGPLKTVDNFVTVDQGSQYIRIRNHKDKGVEEQTRFLVGGEPIFYGREEIEWDLELTIFKQERKGVTVMLILGPEEFLKAQRAEIERKVRMSEDVLPEVDLHPIEFEEEV